MWNDDYDNGFLTSSDRSCSFTLVELCLLVCQCCKDVTSIQGTRGRSSVAIPVFFVL